MLEIFRLFTEGGERLRQNLATFQRIVACGAGATNDVIERRLQKYNYAAMLLESYPPRIYKDCSADGCPGHSLDDTVLAGYVASYGPTQLIGTTMVETLRKLISGDLVERDPNIRQVLHLDDASLWTAVNNAYKRAVFVTKEFKDHRATAAAWADLNPADQKKFKDGTGLDDSSAATVWDDMTSWKQHPKANFNGEASAAFATEVLMSDPVVESYLMEIFKDSLPDGKFSKVSMSLMKSSYSQIVGKVDQTNSFAQSLPDGSANPQWQQRQREIEIELALRTARMHNGDFDNKASKGTIAEVIVEDRSLKGYQYALRFLNVPEYAVQQPANPNSKKPTGDYFSLRCTAELPAAAVPNRGLDMKPLQLN